jgi:hypothetical protein
MTVIIEKFMNPGGHNATQIAAIERLSQGRAFTIITSRTGHRDGSAIRSSLIAILSDNRERKKTPLLAVENDVNQIEQFFSGYKLGQFTSVLIPSADAHDVRVVLHLLERNPAIAIFSLRLLIEPAVGRLSEEELDALRGHVQAQRIALLTETASLSGRLRDRYGLSAKPDFLLPCLAFPDDEIAAPADDRNKTVYRVGYLGGLRKEKGADLIPKILSALLDIMVSSKNSMGIEFVMQDHRTNFRFRNVMYDSRLLWTQFNAFRRTAGRIMIRKLPGYLTNEQFLEAIRSMDIMIVPYDLKAYQFRGSGIIADGVLSLKPAVYTKGIGMSNFLEYGNGEAASSARQFAEAVVSVIKNFEHYKSKALSARSAMLTQLQATSNFLNEI